MVDENGKNAYSYAFASYQESDIQETREILSLIQAAQRKTFPSDLTYRN